MKKAKLLVVEDDLHLLHGLKDILELDDYAVLTAENGRQGLQILQREPDTPPDLIVSDIMMPGMDGMEFLKKVREHERWVTIPFIFLTAKGEKDDFQQGMKHGVDAYMVKPFDAPELLMMIEAKLRRHAAIKRAQSGMIDKLKRNILTILNHEFRTPLTLVVAYADMLRDYDIESMTEAQLLDFLKEISSGAGRLRRLIENFILLVELESGDTARLYDLRKTAIADPVQILQTAYDIALNDPHLSTRLIKRDFRLKVDTPLHAITGDVEMLHIVLRELLDNAVKFSGANTAITLGGRCKDGMLQMWVQDEGRGIPESEQPRIWESFYQINREHHEDQGTGAGLAIVRGLVELHGGNVQLESQLDVGTTVKVNLPLLR